LKRHQIGAAFLLVQPFRSQTAAAQLKPIRG